MSVILKYLSVYALSGLKIILGPTLGVAYGFNTLVTAGISLLGMMTTVYILTFFGNEIRELTIRIFGTRSKKVFSPRKRRFVRIWKKYGVIGIAFLTPLILSPPGGTILANAFGGRRKDILKWMWIFGAIWSLILTGLVKYASWLLEGFDVI